MDPRKWSGAQVLVISLAWILLAVYLPFRGAAGTMTASGPSGGLIGFTTGALLRIALITFGPPLLLLGIWRTGKRRTKPPAV
jgi:hypothetical protein